MPGGITRVGDTATTFDPCNVTGVTTIAGPGAPGLSGVYVNNKIVSTVADTVGSGVVTTASGVENPLTGVFAGTIVAGPPNP